VEVVMRFGEGLIELGFIDKQKLDVALQEQEYTLKTVSFAEPIGLILLRNGVINEKEHYQAVLKYFEYLSKNKSRPAYIRSTAKIALKALRRDTKGRMSHVSKIALINKIQENEEKILQLQKSMLQKKNNLIKHLKLDIEKIKKDLENFA